MHSTKLHAVFHKLWTKAVGTKDYDKKEWLELEAQILHLERVEERYLDEDSWGA